MEEKKSIVIFLYQYSVVVKGIERKLLDEGYFVDILTERYDQIEKLASRADLFLIYLPTDIMDDDGKIKMLWNICEKIRNHGKGIVVIGEKKYHSELVGRVKILDGYGWVDRPIENEILFKEISLGIATPVRGKTKRILIVDDDPSYAGMVREWIKDRYKTDIVTAGMQAITFLLKNPVDLILLDYEMPVVDGPQVLQMLRQESATKDIPVIFLTGVGSKESVSRVMELRPAGYILKTTTRDNLIDTLRNQLG